MKRINLFILLLILSASLASAAVFDPSTLGFGVMATSTLTIGSAAAVIVGTMPANTHTLTVYTDVDLNYGPLGTASGTASPYIPAGSSKDFEHIVSANPTIYLIPRAAATAVVKLRAR